MKRIVWVIIYLLTLAVASLAVSGDFGLPWLKVGQWAVGIPSSVNRLVSPWREEAVVVTALPQFTSPVNGLILSSYGWQKHPFTKLPYYHRALDIGSETGTPVRAVSEGRVSRVYRGVTLGQTLVIQHERGWSSGYAHLGQVLVGEGDFVSSGTVIAQSGTSGLLRLGAEPHLHFMLYFQDVPVDPGQYLAPDQSGRNLQ